MRHETYTNGRTNTDGRRTAEKKEGNLNYSRAFLREIISAIQWLDTSSFKMSLEKKFSRLNLIVFSEPGKRVSFHGLFFFFALLLIEARRKES